MRLEQRPRAQARAHVSRRRRIVSSTVVLALFALPVLLPGTASADAIGDKRAEAQRISAKLDQLDQKLSALDEQFNEATLALQKAQDAIGAAQQRIDETNSELATRTSELRTFSVEAYISGNDTPEFEAILTSTAEDATQKKSFLEAASGSRQDLLDQLNGTKQKAAAEAETLRGAQAEAQAQRDTLQKATDQAAEAVSAQKQLESQANGELHALVVQEQARQAEARRQQAEAALAAATKAKQATARPAVAHPATPPTSRPGPGPVTNPGPPPGAPSSGAAAAVSAAMSQIGVPYVWAGASPGRGFDCSGLVMWAWAQGGRSLPHSSAAMYGATRRISAGDLQPGDLVFYGSPIHHVALYIGNGRIVHAPNAGAYVRTDSIGYWSDLKGYGRV